MRSGRILFLALLLIVSLGSGCSGTQQADRGRNNFRYANLDQLVSAICQDALAEFDYFYLSTNRVNVKPFMVAGEHYIPETSQLSLTLSDHITASLSSLSTLSWFEEMVHDMGLLFTQRKRCEPKMEGFIEELDGYLRVHMSAVNSYGQQRDFVVSAEMSEPLYRALHTEVKVYGL